MSVLRRAVVTLFVAAVPGLASGQGRPAKVTLTRDNTAIIMMHKFAACVARAKPSVIADALARDPADPSYHRILQRLSLERPTCLPPGSILAFNDFSVAGGMAEWMLLHRYRGAALGDAIAAHAADPGPVTYSPAEKIGACVARAAPRESAAVFSTPPTSPEEQTALGALGNAMMGCVGTGNSMRIAKPTFRAGLALAAYRMTQPAAGAGSK